VTNLSWPIALSGYVNEDCVVGREGTNWWLVVPKLEGPTAVFVTQTVQRSYCSSTASSQVLTDVNLSATLDTNSCAITIGKTAVTANVTIVSATATASFISASYTAAFLRLRVP
jgi:hypothetical protein